METMPLSRSEQMARIRGKDTRPEKLLRSALWARGLRYRVRYPVPAGKPDLVFPGRRVVVFVDGCFWHGCPEHYVRPRTRTNFWAQKLRENVERDSRQTVRLERESWSVVRFWEHRVLTDVEAAIGEIEVTLDADTLIPNERRRKDLRVLRADPLPGGDDMEVWTLVELRDPNTCSVIHRKRTTHKW